MKVTTTFLFNLIRVGMVMGFWAGVAVLALTDLTFACVLGAVLTVVVAALVAWDRRRARKAADRG